MATVQDQEFDISASLRGLYKGLPYVTKLGYTVGEIGGSILLKIVVEGDSNADEYHEYSMAAVRKAREFRDMMPASMREEYEVLPFVTYPEEGAQFDFRAMTTVIDRKAEVKAPHGR